ncbi:hypothetical protein [Microseira wollei]|uniref:Uncharacterized protein n=1 Tax=Microseira wollei NIES-4236 TaxID=2530354 RepID=A0AAV3XPD2_9CYAN|nr:hypothetical protein [Microseira wollei]GET42686.1 hypothetical protein MiSe_75040 [Microseira wollei NIES-4236]
MPTPQSQSISSGVFALGGQNAHPTKPVNFFWGLWFGRAECPPHKASQFLLGSLPWAGRMPTPQSQSISCGVGGLQCPPHKASQFLLGSLVWAGCNAHPTKPVNFLWGGRAAMPTPQSQSISCGVGGQNAHPTKPANFLWGGRLARPWDGRNLATYRGQI